MEDQVPQRLKMAAIAQIVSGLINITMGWWMSSCIVGNFCGLFTLYMGGQLCGMVSCLILPLGLVEIGAGAYALMQPREGAGVARIVSFLEIFALLGGGLVAVLAGIGVQVLLNDDEVAAYLEG